jgi:hypothetical protein
MYEDRQKIDEKIATLEKELTDAYTQKAKDQWAEDALSDICGDYYDDNWTSERMEQTIDQIGAVLGSRKDAEILILYLFGRLYETGKVKINIQIDDKTIAINWRSVEYEENSVYCCIENPNNADELVLTISE